MDLPGFPGVRLVPTDPADKLIRDDEVLTTLLSKQEETSPEQHVLLLMRVRGDEYGARSAESFLEWDPTFPTSGPIAVMQLCQIGHKAVLRGELGAYAVAVRQAEHHWDVFGILEDGGQGNLTQKTVTWVGNGIANRVQTLQAMLPELRTRGFITDEERERGVTPEQANARERLSGLLQELIDHYHAAGDEAKVAELWEERGPLILESLKIRWR